MSNITDKSPAPKKSGDITPQQNTPVSSNQESVEELVPKNLSVYIPKNIDIDKILQLNPPNFKHNRNNFLYLLDLIVQIPEKKKRDEFEDLYARPYSDLMQRVVRNYREHLDYLVANGILFEDHQYIKGIKSRGFIFTPKYTT